MKVSPAIRAAIVAGIAAGVTFALVFSGSPGEVTVRSASIEAAPPPAEEPIQTSSTVIYRDDVAETTTTTTVAPTTTTTAPKPTTTTRPPTTTTTVPEVTMPDTPARTISCGPSGIGQSNLHCLVNPIMEPGEVFEPYPADAFPGFAAKVTFADGTAVTAPAPVNCGSFAVPIPEGVDPTGATVEMVW